MADRIAALLERADRVVHGLELNQAAWDEGEVARAEHGNAISYEVVVAAGRSFDDFAREEPGKLREHLRSKGVDASGPPFLRVWVWSGEHAHLFRGAHFFEAVREIRGPIALPPASSNQRM